MPLTSMVIGSTPPATLTGIAGELRVAASRSTSIREPFSGNWMCGACSLPVRTSSPKGRNRRSGSGSLALLAISTPFGGFGSGSRQFSGAGEGIEQDRRGCGAPDQAGYRRAVGTSDPDPDRHAAVEADRPGIAIAVAGAGLERDPVMRARFPAAAFPSAHCRPARPRPDPSAATDRARRPARS